MASSAPQPGPAVLRQIDVMGVRSTADHWASAPPELARRQRLRVLRMGGALLTCAGTSDALRLNRVLGFGRGTGDTRARLDAIVAFYRAARIQRFSILLMPGPRVDTIAGWLRDRGFVRRGGNTLLARRCDLPIPPMPAGVTVRRARRADIPTILAIQQRVFADARSRRPWTEASLAGGATENYLAFVGKRAIGSGALRIDGPLAWLGAGATLPGFRRRGVHRALITTRLRRAARQGCRWAWVETAIPAPGRPGGSRRNMLRLGFVEVGIRPGFVWTAPRDGGSRPGG